MAGLKFKHKSASRAQIVSLLSCYKHSIIYKRESGEPYKKEVYVFVI